MELVDRRSSKTDALRPPAASRAAVGAGALTVAVIAGALLWTAPRTAPTLRAANGSAGSQVSLSGVISLRRGERYRLSRVTRASDLLDPALIEVRRDERSGQ